MLELRLSLAKNIDLIKRVLAIDEFETTLTYKGKTQYTVYFKSSPFLGSMNLNGVSPWIVVY